jgi:hypothetical protein
VDRPQRHRGHREKKRRRFAAETAEAAEETRRGEAKSGIGRNASRRLHRLSFSLVVFSLRFLR